MRANGLQILLSVVKAPPCYKEPGSPPGHGPPVDPATFGRFMEAIASRYKGRVQAYELWNEANLQREWTTLRPRDPNNTAHLEFLELVKHGYTGGKRGDPQRLHGVGRPDAGGQHAPCHRRPPILAAPLGCQRRLRSPTTSSSWACIPTAGRTRRTTRVQQPGGEPRQVQRRLVHARQLLLQPLRAVVYQDMIQRRVPAFRDKTLWLTEFGWATTPNPAAGYEYARDATPSRTRRTTSCAPSPRCGRKRPM